MQFGNKNGLNYYEIRLKFTNLFVETITLKNHNYKNINIYHRIN